MVVGVCYFKIICLNKSYGIDPYCAQGTSIRLATQKCCCAVELCGERFCQ